MPSQKSQTLRRAGLALVALLMAALAMAQPASAHAILVRSVPESNSDLGSPPPTIEMWFSEPLEAAFSSARVIDSSGGEVPTGAAVLDPSDPTHLTLPLGDLGPGIYTVAWQTFSQVDGHEWFGSFPFTVLNPDGTRPSSTAAGVEGGSRGELPSPGEASARWLSLVGGMLMFGALVFSSVVVPVNRFPVLSVRARQLLVWALWGAAAGIFLGSAAQLLLQAQRLGGLATVPKLILATRSGAVVLARVLFAATGLNAGLELARPKDGAWRRAVLDIATYAIVVLLLVLLAGTTEQIVALITLAVVVGCLAWTARSLRRGSVVPETSRIQALTVLAVGILLSFSLSSHAGAAPGSLFAVAGDSLHLLAASAWIGGLLSLPILWLMTRDGSGREEFFPAVQRFSTLAASAVYIVLLTGVFSALVELPTLRSLWDTPYGVVLLVKLALVILALGIAYLNNRAVRAATHSAVLPRRIAVEAGISALILVTVAFLVQTPTPRSLQVPASPAAARLPFNAIGFTGDLNIHLQVDPNQAGSNRFWTHLFMSDGSSIGEVQLVRLLFEYLDQPLGKSSIDLGPLGQGTFASEGANLSQVGQWAVDVYVRRRGMDDILARYTLEVAAGQASAAAPSLFGHPVPGMPALVLVGGLVLCAGLVPFLWRREVKVLAGTSYRAWLRLGGGVVFLGIIALVFGLTTARAAEVPLLERSNPVPATADSLARGEEVYLQACWICHGPAGLGDGPVGVTLNPRPSNLRIHTVPGVHTDGQLFEWVANGFPNSAMPEFSETYSEEDRWNVINYIRTFAAGEVP